MPLLSGQPASYHFMADFFTSILQKINVSFITTLNLPGCLFCINLILLVYLFSKKIARNSISAALSTILFFFCGGLGFIYWKKGTGFIELTQLNEKGIFFANITPAQLIPQKASLFGTTICLIIFITLWNNLKKTNLKSLFFASLIISLLPLTYIHGFFVSSFFLFFFYIYKIIQLIKLKRFKRAIHLTLGLSIPIIFIALPQIIYFYPSVFSRTKNFSFWHPFWTKPAQENILLFYLKNFGLFPLLLIFGLLKTDRKRLMFYFPAIVLFALANSILFQPTVFENIKIIYFWYLFSCPFVAIFLNKLFKKNLFAFVLGLLLFISMTLSGMYDSFNLLFPKKYKVMVFQQKHFQVADWIKKNTPGDAVFLTAPHHDHPVCSLAGRQIFLGFEGWLYTYGINTNKRKQQLDKVFSGRVDKTVFEKNNINYIYIGEGEKNLKNINLQYFQNNYQQVYNKNEVLIFKL